MVRPLALRNIVGAAGLLGLALLLGGCPFSTIISPGRPVAQNVAPTIQFTQPLGRVTVTVGDLLVLSWSDTDPDDDATIRLFYDQDGTLDGNEVTIASLSEDAEGTGDQFGWNTTGLAPGVYRIGATIDDAQNPPVTVYLAYEVILRAAVTPGTIPSFRMLQPAANVARRPGESIVLAWTDDDPDYSADIYLYYDADLIGDNGNERLIALVAEDPDTVGADEYGWTIPPSLPTGVYYILGRMTDGVNPDVTWYAPGSVSVGALTPTDQVRELTQIGTAFAGITINGYRANARLGDVMLGGRDIDGDGATDFVLVAPQSVSDAYEQLYGDANARVGEAYLIYPPVNVRWPMGTVLSVGKAATYELRSSKIVGMAYSIATEGIQAVTWVDDLDGDNLPELVFGLPNVNEVLREQQDYDPTDNPDLHTSDTDPWSGIPDPACLGHPGRYHYMWNIWKPYPDEESGTVDDAMIEYLRSGVVVWLSSTAPMEGNIVLLDDVGQPLKLDLIRNAYVFQNGMRTYPPQPFVPVFDPDCRLDGAGTHDTSMFGQGLAAVDIDGDEIDDLFVSQPMLNGQIGAIWTIVHEGWPSWTDELGDLDVDPTPEAYSWPVAETLDLPDPYDDDRIATFPAAPNHAWPINWWINGDGSIGPQGHLGNPLALGDFDGDTVKDLAVSAPDADPDGLTGAGVAYIVYGTPGFSGAETAQFRTQDDLGFELRGTAAGDRLGFRMVAPGDMTGDGRVEWLVSAPWRDWQGRANCGAVVLIDGGSKTQFVGTGTFDQVGSTIPGAVLYGANANDNFGYYMADAGDVDGDAYPDFLIAAPGYDGPGRANCGAVYLIYGGPHLVGDFDVRDIGTPQLPGKLYLGPEANAQVGPVSRAGDTDGDRRADFLIAYPGADAAGMIDSGRVWLIYGSARQDR